MKKCKKKCREPGSNQRPLDLQSNALPTELSRHTDYHAPLSRPSLNPKTRSPRRGGGGGGGSDTGKMTWCAAAASQGQADQRAGWRVGLHGLVGYDISLTPRRSPVRSRVWSLHFFSRVRRRQRASSASSEKVQHSRQHPAASSQQAAAGGAGGSSIRLRPYGAENTTSHPNREVKLRAASIVLRWGTTREVLVL